MTIRAEYVAGGISQRDIAAKYGLSPNTLMNRANKDGWKKDRDKAERKALARAQQKTAEVAASNAVKLERARTLLIDHIVRAIEGMPKNGGTHTRQSQTDKETGKQMSIDYDLQSLVSALEKLSTGTSADAERQKRFLDENNNTMMTYADLFSRPARKRTIEELEGDD